MDVELYGVRMQARILQVREEIEANYDQYPDTTFNWAFVDLVDSSNYRLVHGPKAGYIRAEMFFALVAEAIRPNPEVRILKEIGDASLICAREFRPIFESVMMIDQVASVLAKSGDSERFPFGVRIGIGVGAAKKLDRRHEDYVGTSLDQLARVMGVRSQSTNVLIHEEAYQASHAILGEYPFAKCGDVRLLPLEKAKNIATSVYYRELAVDSVARAKFRDHFVPWRNARNATAHD